MEEQTLSEFIDKLIFASEQNAEARIWWVSVTIDEAYQVLPRYEAEFLEELML